MKYINDYVFRTPLTEFSGSEHEEALILAIAFVSILTFVLQAMKYMFIGHRCAGFSESSLLTK